MKTFIFIFFVATTINLISSPAQSAITGSQCQSHLAQVTDIINKRENLTSYWKINDEITNILGISLNEISRTLSQDPVVQDFVGSVATTINECQSHCGGVIRRNGQKISCKELGEKTILDVNNTIKDIDGHFVSEGTAEEIEVFSPAPISSDDSHLSSPCAGGLETDSCQIFLDELEGEAEHVTVRAILASSLPECIHGQENTDSCQILLDEIFDKTSVSEPSSGFVMQDSLFSPSLQ